MQSILILGKMSTTEYSIDKAYDRISKEKLYAGDLFYNYKAGFKVRKEFNLNKYDFECIECGQKLTVSTSSNDIQYFRHFPNHNQCLLSSKIASQSEKNLIKTIFEVKESQRHKDLKLKIYEKLKRDPEVDQSSICVDDRFLFFDDEKRKPDIYFKYKGYEIVFEIQLSRLPPSYIYQRADFYRKKNIFLIWVLEKYDVDKQGTFEKDIKYLAPYHNFFRLNEYAGDFLFICEFKKPEISRYNSVITPWTSAKINLSDLQFNTSNLEAYYFNFPFEKNKLDQINSIKERERKEIVERERIERKEIAQKVERDHIVKNKVQNILDKIGRVKDWKNKNFDNIQKIIEDSASDVKYELNRRIGFKSKKGTLILRMKRSKNDDEQLLYFLLSFKVIEKNINEVNTEFETVLSALLRNETISHSIKKRLVLLLFQEGYFLKENDESILLTEGNNILHPFIAKCMEKCSNSEHIDKLFTSRKIQNFLFAMDSLLKREIVGLKYSGDKWMVQVGDYLLHNFKEYIHIIAPLFEENNTIKYINEFDKKGTVKTKFAQINPSFQSENDDLFMNLYPELKKHLGKVL